MRYIPAIMMVFLIGCHSEHKPPSSVINSTGDGNINAISSNDTTEPSPYSYDIEIFCPGEKSFHSHTARWAEKDLGEYVGEWVGHGCAVYVSREESKRCDG